ncbi:ATP-binding protein [uncultured Croceitalea sp.]|uniref:ATP-binding protein n=1 Tax=uncultured Croceitalea sp. TaxID=1798908 RepID=UPI00374F0397
MNTKELLTQLSKIEDGLNQFSFEELSVLEASNLKKSFESFKNGLEEKVFGERDTETIIVSSTNEVRKNSTTTESSLIANVSHEIRTPLNGIVGFIDLLQETKLTKKQQELVNALGTSSNNLMNIINELLEFSKLSAGKERFEFVEFNLKNLLEELSYLSETLIVDKNIKFNLIADKNIPEYIIGDPSKLSQVLLNLLGNAIKFVEKGEITLTAKLKSITANELRLGFKISDTGIGIAGDKLEKIFGSYQQAEFDTHAKYGGTGLGLTIVKEIIDQLKGKISVSSALGIGTTFRLEIPYLKTSKNNSKIEEEKEVNTMAHSNELAGMTVLIFEDNELNQKLITSRLKNWGCKTIVTDNGIYGLKLLNNHKIDVVLMDLRMPEMTGFEITKKIRNSSNPKIKNTEIIALSADFSKSDKEQFNALGINDFILKPFKPNELLKKIINSKNRKMMGQEAKIEIMPAISKTNAVTTELNLDQVLEDCMGKIELLEELAQLFNKNILEFIGKTKVHLLNNDFEGIAFTAHKIKSGLRMFKLNSLIEICEQMSLVCKSNKDTKHLSFLYEEFLKEYENIAPKIELEIQRIKTL